MGDHIQVNEIILNNSVNGEVQETVTSMEANFADEDPDRFEATVAFAVDNFSQVKHILLPPFMIRNLPWKIKIMKRSNSVANPLQKSLGFYLQCNGDSESSSWNCCAEASLTILSQKEGVKDFTRKITHFFNPVENDWGFSNFLPWNDVIESNKGYNKNDTVIFQVQVKADAPHGISDVKCH